MIDKIRKLVVKMGVLNIILFSISVTLVSCNEFVPVLLWNSQATQNSYPVIPALSKLSSNEFLDYLLKRVKVEKPVILVFMEENLSVEDFSWKDLNGDGSYPMLSNVTRMAEDVAFLPSVRDPYKGLKKLKSHGYLWKNFEKDFDSLKNGKNAIFEVKLDEPYYLEDRPDMLKRHDEKIARIYNEAVAWNPNVVVIYTGNHTSWIDAELGRFKREEKDIKKNNTLIIHDANDVVRIETTKPIIFKKKGADNNIIVVNITDLHGDPTVKEEKGELILRVRFPLNNNEDDFVHFKFVNETGDWWTLKSIDIDTMKETNLKPSYDIGAPGSCSYFCNPSVEFSNGNTSFTFEDFQVQPRVGKGNPFGPVVHCIPFFSVAILSGLVIVFILSVVLAWGISMIMGINTNDRFDDPKGKTITITASD